MTNSYKAPNKRIIPRDNTGRFRKPRPQDFGIGGVCEICRHLLLQHYDGDPRDRPQDPGKRRYRCFTCEPKTTTELALDAEIRAEKLPDAGFVEMVRQASNSAIEQENQSK